MKRIILTLVVFALIIGCKKNDNTSNKQTIVSSFYPIYIMVLNIAKGVNDVEIINMTKPQTGCLHDYQLSPDDVTTLEHANYFIINGAGMEAFIDKVIKQLPNLKIIDSGKSIPLIKAEGEVQDNPHLWVSVSDAILQVKNIGEQLSLLDAKNAELYKRNTDEYVKKLEALKLRMHEKLDGIRNRDIITFHEAFLYFAKEFNFNIVGVIEREPGSQPSARELADTIATIKKLKVKAIFAEPQYPVKAADSIALETGLKVYILDPAVTGENNLDSYILTMDNNLKVLLEALK